MKEKFSGTVVKIQDRRPTFFIRFPSADSQFEHLDRVKVILPRDEAKEKRNVKGIVLMRFEKNKEDLFKKKIDVLLPSPTGDQFDYEHGETVNVVLSKPAFPLSNDKTFNQTESSSSQQES